MFWYRFGAGLIILTIAGAFFYWEYKFFPERVVRSLKPRPTYQAKQIPYQDLVAPPPSKTEKSPPAKAIAFKRSYEEPEGFQLTPPLLDNLVTPSHLDTEPTPTIVPNQELFPIPDTIRHAVDFWKNIYATYSSDQVVLHDKRYLQVVYEVLDFSSLRQSGLDRSEIYLIKKRTLNEKMGAIRRALKKLHASRGNATQLDPLEAKIWKLWAFLEDSNKFKIANKELRSQTGIRNRFITAIQRSGAYMPYMEDTFRSYQMPLELTRLAFVESMFENKALSKTGAAGIWQFMPATAKLFMKLNEWVDERLDPLIATDSAARLLKSNYELLGTWPLAINAYNSGPGRLQKAVRRLGTDDIGEIITRYKGSGYGFASRNFYPSFAAALEVVSNYQHHFGNLPIYEPITYEVVKLPTKARLADIADILELDMASLQDLNPSFRRKLFENDVYLPAEATVRVPLGDGARVIAGVYNLDLIQQVSLSADNTESTQKNN